MDNSKHKAGKQLLLSLEKLPVAKPRVESLREGAVIDMEVKYLHFEKRIMTSLNLRAS